jgi:hypothetical protein
MYQQESGGAGGVDRCGKDGQAVRSPINTNVWKVIKGDGTWYLVEIGKMPNVCSCRFYRENAQHGVCKHIVFIETEAEAQAFCSRLVTAGTPASMAYASA